MPCSAVRQAAGPPIPWRLDFTKARSQSGADPLLRAIGKRAKTVVDATAGWATDALHLARSGYHVVALEQHHAVAALLLQAHAECAEQALRSRLEIVHGDSVAYLRALQSQSRPERPDVVYLDPMYPPAANSAAAKKPLVLLRALVGAAPAADCMPLFEQAMQCAQQRVVVKRRRRAPPLHAGKVGETHGKLVRFDIYKPYAK